RWIKRGSPDRGHRGRACAAPEVGCSAGRVPARTCLRPIRAQSACRKSTSCREEIRRTSVSRQGLRAASVRFRCREDRVPDASRSACEPASGKTETLVETGLRRHWKDGSPWVPAHGMNCLHWIYYRRTALMNKVSVSIGRNASEDHH